jgi:cysteine protease ATG4
VNTHPQTLYKFPQMVGIAGGRSSSAYYFVGFQASNLFYLDPHHVRPAVPLRPPPKTETPPTLRPGWECKTAPELMEQQNPQHHQQQQSSPNSNTSGQHIPTAPLSTSTLTAGSTTSSTVLLSHSQVQSAQAGLSPPCTPGSPGLMLSSDNRDLGSEKEVDVVQQHYVNAYSAAELQTFHSEQVRKMTLSELDPSILLGFLCKDEEDWDNFKMRVNDVSFCFIFWV